MTIKGGDMIPLSADGFLLKGSVLRNTGWAVGIAVYTGHDTKIMMNNQQGV
jgi:magnesium-transporting ATPase (P-type)